MVSHRYRVRAICHLVLFVCLCCSSVLAFNGGVSKPRSGKSSANAAAVLVQSPVEKKKELAIVPEVESQQEESPSLAIWELAVAGSLATLLSDSVMHPVDCIKTLLQSDEGLGVGMVGSVAYLWHHYGIQGFYHGLGAYASSDAIGGALKFSTFESLKRFIERTKVLPDYAAQVGTFVCAAIAFCVSSSITVPGELLKQQLQMGIHANLLDATTHIYQADGIKGFFWGYDGVCLRDVPYTMLELGLYDLIKKQQQQREENSNSWWSTLEPWQRDIAAAAITGGVAAFVTTPLDTIKTKVMVDSYSSFWDCFVTTVQQHGPLSVFAGADARVAWLVPFTAIYLPLYDVIKRQFLDVSVHTRTGE